MTDVNYFDQIRISLASAEDIRSWSHGEVKKPETINYRTLKPEKDGLFCEKIFGPTRDWECACGKYKRNRFKGIICERCGVEVTTAKVRRERMGHIELAAPVTHIWYFKGVPSRLGYLLDLAPKDLEKIIYFDSYLITSVDEEQRAADLTSLAAEVESEIRTLESRRDFDVEARLKELEEELRQLEGEEASSATRRSVRSAAEKEVEAIRTRAQRRVDTIQEAWETFRSLKAHDLVGDEMLWRAMRERFGAYFKGSMGAEAIKQRLLDFDLQAEAESLREAISVGKGQRKARAIKRLKVVSAFLDGPSSPLGMILEAVPVIAPDLRPMVQLDGGRFATSDLNDLYRRVINRNSRLKRLLDLGAPEAIVNNEKRMLQEAVDSLFDNGRRGRPVTGPANRPLKSLSDMLKGKQGRFRQNLLGKRVDYSGRSVIVVGPQLKLHQCGLPKQMALELFKPFVMSRLVAEGIAQNVKAAKRMVERSRPEVWDVLEEVITGHPVLLNRAPTLHRLGIQAFEPQLVEGKAIHLHPLVCTAFNADFDGDQMAVHVPLSPEAQAEARLLMLASNNILKLSDGRPVTLPTQDMVIGLYYLTSMREGLPGEDRVFSSVSEAVMANDNHDLDLQARVSIRFPGGEPPKGALPTGWTPEDGVVLETTLGRALFNEVLPDGFPYVEETVGKSQLSRIVNDLVEQYKRQVAPTLDALKELGFHWATRSGTTIAVSDVISPDTKPEILERFEAKAEKVQRDYERGLTTDDERRGELITLWTEATNMVASAMQENFSPDNAIFQMIDSGARGNWMQVRQIAGMRGLVANPKGEVIPRPIKSNYREGLSVLEFFIATHGARKGLADTALRTADSGYLTRRLVDVSQDVIVREQDCGTRRGLVLPVGEVDSAGRLVVHSTVESSVYHRTLAEDVVVDGEVVLAAGSLMNGVVIRSLVDQGVRDVRIRSVLTCQAEVGTCASCYGASMATGDPVEIGEAVGIIAAQSIGEPGTQLTMRTFHTGGAASESGDITHGLPRVVELFEARTPKGVAPISESTGIVRVEDTTKGRQVVVTPDDGSEETSYPIPARARLLVGEGQHVELGDKLTHGASDPKQVLRILGPRAAQQHLVNEVQDVYRSQGVGIHDKHIEVIVRQMLRRVTIIESGDTHLLPGELAPRDRFETENRRVVSEGGQPASGRPELLGITKASLATDSWLSAASFQETTRVLTEAATEGRRDGLRGMKENVIIGKLVPAGTGLAVYNQIRVAPTSEAIDSRTPDLPGGTSFDEGEFGQAVALEEIDTDFR